MLGAYRGYQGHRVRRRVRGVRVRMHEMRRRAALRADAMSKLYADITRKYTATKRASASSTTTSRRVGVHPHVSGTTMFHTRRRSQHRSPSRKWRATRQRSAGIRISREGVEVTIDLRRGRGGLTPTSRSRSRCRRESVWTRWRRSSRTANKGASALIRRRAAARGTTDLVVSPAGHTAPSCMRRDGALISPERGRMRQATSSPRRAADTGPWTSIARPRVDAR